MDNKNKVTLEITDDVQAKIAKDLKFHLSKEDVKEKMAKNEEFAAMINQIAENKTNAFSLWASPAPEYRYGYVDGDATAVGEQEGYGERTIARGFKSIEAYVYSVDGEEFSIDHPNFIAEKILGLKPYHPKAAVIARGAAEEVCGTDLKRLNYSMKSCRLNRWTFIETKERLQTHIFPIHADFFGAKKRISAFLGYYDLDNDVTVFNIRVPMSKGKKTVLGFLVALLALAAVAGIAYLLTH